MLTTFCIFNAPDFVIQSVGGIYCYALSRNSKSSDAIILSNEEGQRVAGTPLISVNEPFRVI